ncbi:FAD-dependent oxidoreductase [Chelatococcus reniformis]|uniref:Sarcosine oxidase subunit beta n=1 Tax=Chelatococcus reniformis TaxID=1494448 RepID=A0A916USK0_9HYPH|nr:FAD-dependent oxidoreductase [Chelatococcus reniformis]GGC86301.1 sarcosine oxidase subunit beta [Chelatococcus reniformis]
MPLALLKHGLSSGRVEPPHLRWQPDLKRTYDVVIIGAGGHGLATAYYLATRHGITNIAVLDRGWLAGGNTARNTTIVRANYLTPEGVAFYKESVELFRGLSTELDINIMYSERGHFTLAHTDAAIRTARWRAEVNKHMGVDSELIDAAEVARLCPVLNTSDEVHYPILGALYHPPGAIARHDAVAWGYAKEAMARGVEVHPATEVTGILVEGGRVRGVETSRGTIHADKVVQAVAGSSSRVAKLAGLRLPIKSIPLQACVSEPVKPILDQIVVSGSLHVYISQSARGEMVMGGVTDPYGLYQTRSTLDFKEGLMAHMLELFPFMADLRVLRQWAGTADMTPDFSPVMGLTPIDNYFIDSGWGTWGFKATPVCGLRMAECIATGRQPEMLKPFLLDRFRTFDLVGEKGAASVGH